MTLVKMNGIERHYEMASGTVKALDGINLDIEEGERILYDPTSDIVAHAIRAHDLTDALVESVGFTLGKGTIHHILLGEHEGVDKF